jgi:hypothetical protein
MVAPRSARAVGNGQHPKSGVGGRDRFGASATEVTKLHERPQRVDSGYQRCASVLLATPELG